MTVNVSAPPTCSARVGTFAGEWQEQPLWCSTTVGLTAYTDNYGKTRHYCRHHKGIVLHRYPVGSHDDHDLTDRFDPSCPECERRMDRAREAMFA